MPISRYAYSDMGFEVTNRGLGRYCRIHCRSVDFGRTTKSVRILVTSPEVLEFWCASKSHSNLRSH